MDLRADKVLLAYFYEWENSTPDKVYLKQPFGDIYEDTTWHEAGQQIRKMATFLKKLPLEKGSNIGLFSKNCAEWILADLAINMAGHVSVPFYPTLTAEQLNQVLVHSECKYLFVGKLDGWQDTKVGVPEEVQCISFPKYNPDPNHWQWNIILEQNEPFLENYLPGLEDLHTIIYTSGTTGNPKGVMMKNRATAEVLYHTKHISGAFLNETRFLSYLPLCHIAERNIVEALSIVTGGTIYFTESLETFTHNLQTAQPSHFLAVPRIWTKFQLGILEKLPEKKLNLLLKIPIVNKVIKQKIKQNLGLSKAKIILTGAAPMPASLIRWFMKLGIKIQDVYGMTENLGAVCMMPPDEFKENFVGKIHPGIEVKIDPETGEILTKSDWTMSGYYREPDMTAQTIDADGWLHTGDVGEVSHDGFLKITGRVKEMYKTSKGEYVAPAQIEFCFAENEMIDQVCVVGQNLPQPIALMVLSEIGLKKSKEELNALFEETLKTINPKLKSYERVKKIVIMSEPWSVVNNLLTPTLKIKRNLIEKKFGEQFEFWYSTPENILWN